MNVLITADYPSPVSGNFIPSLIAIAHTIENNGGNAVFAFPAYRSWVDWIVRERFSVKIIGKNIESENDKAVKLLTDIVKKYEINVVHIHFGLFLKTIIENRKDFKNISVLFHDHMGYSLAHRNFLMFFYYAYLSSVYAKNKINVVTVTKRKYHNYIFQKNKWFLPNAISFERNVERSLTRDEFRKLHEIHENEKLCFVLGWDIEIKGVDVALKSVAKCRELDPTIIFGIIGLSKSERREKLKNKTGIDIEKESWVKIFDSQEDMYAVHRAVDCFISSSRSEGFPYAVLEAISQNTPLVLSDIAGTKWATQYSNSHMYHCENIDDCAKKILDALSVGRVETNSRELLEKYNLDDWCSRILNIYEQCNIDSKKN